MVTPSTGAVVLVRFFFSDLSSTKLRPAIVLADADNDDWVLCQVTSNPYADMKAICIEEDAFLHGSLHRISYVRPAKLFTANVSLMATKVGQLTAVCQSQVVDAVVNLLKS